MDIEIQPVVKLDASVKAPSSKGFTLRALYIAALAEGQSLIKDALIAEDQLLSIKALESMGVKINRKGNDILVEGGGGELNAPKKELFLGNSGVGIRFMASLAALAKGETLLTGNERMMERPIKDLTETLGSLGANLEILGENGCPPLRVKGPSLAGGKGLIDCSKSSQFLSSILVAAPYAKEDVELEIKGELRSKPFIDMTIHSMNDFGVAVENHNYEKFAVKSGQKYEGRDYRVEGDYTNVSYFFAAAAITDGKIKVENLNPHSVQGDLFLLDIFERMGCKVHFGDNFAELEGGKLSGIEVDMSDYPDVVQTLAVVASFAKGKTKIKNIAHLRIKETDRISATAAELKKLGVGVVEDEDSLTIVGGVKNGASIETYNDHRMAMAFAVAGLRQEGIVIKDVECVKKSFPNYFEELVKLGD